MEPWDEVYRDRGADAVSWFEPSPEVSLALLDAVAAGPSSATIDVGGGASRLVDALLSRGFGDLTVLDLSAEALAVARRRLGRAAEDVSWIVADVTRWVPERTFDVWHDRAMLHFLVEEGDRQAYRERLIAALPPGGHAILATFAPDGPERCSGLPVRRHDTDAFAAFLGECFALVADRRHDHRTLAGVVQRFQYAAFRRTA